MAALPQARAQRVGTSDAMAPADPWWFVHPLLGTLVLIGVMTNLWLGQRITAAATDAAVAARLRKWHIRLGATLALGGPLVLLAGVRGIAAAGLPVLGSFHGFLGVLTAALLGMVGLTGLLLHRGREAVRPRHRMLARTVGLLLALQLLSGLGLTSLVLGGG